MRFRAAVLDRANTPLSIDTLQLEFNARF